MLTNNGSKQNRIAEPVSRSVDPDRAQEGDIWSGTQAPWGRANAALEATAFQFKPHAGADLIRQRNFASDISRNYHFNG
jgi:hypothetical protein